MSNIWGSTLEKLYQTMEDELLVLEQKVCLIDKLKTLDRDRWLEIRHDRHFIALARQYKKLQEQDTVAFWSRKVCKTS